METYTIDHAPYNKRHRHLTFSLRQECVEAQDELRIAPEQVLHLVDYAWRVDPVWNVMYDAWCMMYREFGVWCVIYGVSVVWCVMYVALTIGF